MRISVDTDDPGYEAFVRYGGHDSTLEIWFEGEKLDDCVTADTELGLVVRLDPENHQIWMKDVPRIERRGHVKIMLNGAVLASSPIPFTVVPQTPKEEANAFVISRAAKRLPVDMHGDSIDDEATKTAYVAIRIKASDRLHCPVCGHADPGHEGYCHVPAQLRAFGIEPDAVKIKRVTDDPDSVTIPLTFERLRIDLPPSHEMGDPPRVTIPAEFFNPNGRFKSFADECRKMAAILGIPRHIAEAADKANTEAMRQRLTGHDPQKLIVDDPFANSYITADDLRAAMGWFDRKPRRSIIGALMAMRRAHKAKPFTTEHDEGVHRAISAMQKPGRAHEL